MSTQKASRLAAAACQGKTPFKTWSMAKRVLAQVVDREGRDPYPGHELAVYHCHHCHRLHIGNQPKKRGRR